MSDKSDRDKNNVMKEASHKYSLSVAALRLVSFVQTKLIKLISQTSIYLFSEILWLMALTRLNLIKICQKGLQNTA